MFQNVPDFIYTHVLLILQCIKSNNIDNNHKCSLRNCNIQLKRTIKNKNKKGCSSPVPPHDVAI